MRKTLEHKVRPGYGAVTGFTCRNAIGRCRSSLAKKRLS